MWIQLANGEKYSLENPNWEVLNIEMLAHALSKMCRYGGQCRDFYSVAQHSVLVSKLVAPKLRKPALLHDAHEAVWGLGDILTPAKGLLPNLKYYRDLHMHAIASKHGLTIEHLKHSEVKFADNLAKALEKRDYLEHQIPWDVPMPPVAGLRKLPEPLLPKEAERQFLDHWREAIS